MRDLRPYISVDVEASGPSPSLHAMLSLGACSVADPRRTFYVELQPTSTLVDPEAMAIHGLSLERLQETGIEPATAMARFEAWIEEVVPSGLPPVFVSYNAPFDWQFVNDAFHRTLGRNPFGHAPLDVRALSMGLSGREWTAIRLDELTDRLLGGRRLTHNALDDAVLQAELFRALVDLLPSPGP